MRPFGQVSWQKVFARTMRSGGENFKCPLCGRVSNEFPLVDGMFYPVCTDSDYSCLRHQFYDKGLSPAQIVANALQKVFGKSKWGDLSGLVLVNIAKFVIEDADPIRAASQRSSSLC